MVGCIVWQGEEEHSLWGSKQFRTMQASKRDKPDLVPGPRTIIMGSMVPLSNINLLNIDENEFVDDKVSYIAT